MVKSGITKRDIFSRMTLMIRRRKTKENQQESTRRPLTVGHALKGVLTQAAASNRLTTGTIECTNVLNQDPEKILLCVLPEARDSNHFMQIHNKLIEAYCRENEIKLVKVDSADKLVPLLPSNNAKSDDEKWNAGSECMVVKRPLSLSKEEDFVVTYHDTIVYCEIYPIPLIEIPE